uniref:Uncharacterized protein n=1 Tax=Oryza brachyantha TaxID=4533 RepID=J3L0K5_ORYBR
MATSGEATSAARAPAQTKTKTTNGRLARRKTKKERGAPAATTKPTAERGGPRRRNVQKRGRRPAKSKAQH